jgi:hypothetical protein
MWLAVDGVFLNLVTAGAVPCGAVLWREDFMFAAGFKKKC